MIKYRYMASNGTNPAHILLVEDQEHERNLISMTLQKSGYEVTDCGSASEALELCRVVPFDAVVTDLVMPEIDGLALMRRLRGSLSATSVILVTGNPNFGSAVHAIEQGAFRYLTKPLSPKKLIEAVEHAIYATNISRMQTEALRLTQSTQNRPDNLKEQFEVALRHIWIAYQPVVNRVGRRIGFEAFVRPGTKSPATTKELFTLAETLGRWSEVVSKARHIAIEEWRVKFSNTPDLLFVNVHPDELQSNHIENSNVIDSADRIVLEFSDAIDYSEVNNLSERVERLRGLGSRIAADNFGSGTLGLSHLLQLSPDFLKIGRDLVANIQSYPAQQKLISEVHRLCNSLEIALIAVGVENEKEAETLSRLGCQYFQGYYFGAPAPFPAVT